jgi:hypothetical protein
LLGKIVVDAEGVLAAVTEVFAHGAAGVGRQILHGGGIGSGGGDDDGIVHGAVFFERLHHLGNGGALLTDGDVDTDDVAALLIDDGVEGYGGFSGLAVADDQLTLAASDGDHAVDGLNAGLKRLFDGAAFDDAGSDALHGVVLGGVDGPFAVDGVAEGVDDTANQAGADGDGHNAIGAADFIAFANLFRIAEEHDADLVFFQVHGEAGDTMGQLDELAVHDVFQAMDAGDTVAHGNHRPGFGNTDCLFEVFDLLTEEPRNFIRSNLSHKLILPSAGDAVRVKRRRRACAAGYTIARAQSRRKWLNRFAPPHRPGERGQRNIEHGHACR